MDDEQIKAEVIRRIIESTKLHGRASTVQQGAELAYEAVKPFLRPGFQNTEEDYNV